MLLRAMGSWAAVVATVLLGNSLAVSPADAAAPGATVLVSRNNAGEPGNDFSFGPSVSADGRYVAFYAAASNLVAHDANGGYNDVFVRDMLSGRTRLVSRSSSGVQGNTGSSQPSISANGRYVAFYAEATNLVAGDTNGAFDVFVRDLVEGRTVRVSVSSAGGQGNGDSGAYDAPAISADGRYVAFRSKASNLVPGDTNGTSDVFVRDVLTGRTRLVSRSTTGAEGNGDSYAASISADGRYVAFASSADNLVAGDTNGTYDVFVRDVLAGRTVLASRGSTGAPAAGASTSPSISADGRYVAFGSDAALVPDDTNGIVDVFVRDLVANRTVLASRSSTGALSNSGGYGYYVPSISGDGRYVAFYSAASNLAPGDSNGRFDLFVRDLVRGRTVLASRNSSGVEGDRDSFDTSSPAISYTGRYTGFASSATNLDPVAAIGQPQMYRRDLFG